jgi:ribosomal silencing factor RsfS
MRRWYLFGFGSTIVNVFQEAARNEGLSGLIDV